VAGTVFACSGYAEDGRPLEIRELAAPLATHPEELRTTSWDGLRDWAEQGLEIGSHTVSHPHLPALSDAELAVELRESRARIEDELARPCTILAYPYGELDDRVRNAVRRAGYEAAYALRAETRPFDRYALPRVDLYRKDTALRSAAKTSAIRLLPVSVQERLFPARPRLPGET
jgi:peptidoglycan/xylan/chitin deacetylase (PgdA/CDA1 family)